MSVFAPLAVGSSRSRSLPMSVLSVRLLVVLTCLTAVESVRPRRQSHKGSTPTDAKISPKSFLGKYGHSVELRCRTSGGRPAPSDVRWFKDNQPLVPSHRVSISRTVTSGGSLRSELVISEVTVSDAGGYTCRASNVFGHISSSISTVAVANPKATKHKYATLCPIHQQSMCHNEGSCYQLVKLNNTYCECEHPWTGQTCMVYRSDGVVETTTGVIYSGTGIAPITRTGDDDLSSGSIGGLFTTNTVLVVLGVVLIGMFAVILYYLITLKNQLQGVQVQKHRTIRSTKTAVVNGKSTTQTGTETETGVIQCCIFDTRKYQTQTETETETETTRRQPINDEPAPVTRDLTSDAVDGADVQMRRVRNNLKSTSTTYDNGDYINGRRNADERTVKCCLSVPDSGTERHSTGQRRRLTATSITPEPCAIMPSFDRMEEVHSTPLTRSPPIAGRMSSTLPATTTPNGVLKPNRTGSIGAITPVAVGELPIGSPRRCEQPHPWTSVENHRPIIITCADDEFDNVGRSNDEDDVETVRREEDDALRALLAELTDFDVHGRSLVPAENHQAGHYYVDLRS